MPHMVKNKLFHLNKECRLKLHISSPRFLWQQTGLTSNDLVLQRSSWYICDTTLNLFGLCRNWSNDRGNDDKIGMDVLVWSSSIGGFSASMYCSSDKCDMSFFNDLMEFLYAKYGALCGSPLMSNLCIWYACSV